MSWTNLFTLSDGIVNEGTKGCGGNEGTVALDGFNLSFVDCYTAIGDDVFRTALASHSLSKCGELINYFIVINKSKYFENVEINSRVMRASRDSVGHVRIPDDHISVRSDSDAALKGKKERFIYDSL